jgi:hypothetical protein
MLPFWRLEPPFRFAVYIAFAVLFASGAAWLVDDQLKETSNGEIWQQAAAYLLMVHGGAAMVTLMLLGALFPLHVGRAWRAKKNRGTGMWPWTFLPFLRPFRPFSPKGLIIRKSQWKAAWPSSKNC